MLCGLHFRFFLFVSPTHAPNEEKAFTQGFTVNQSYVMKASFYVSVCCPDYDKKKKHLKCFQSALALHASSFYNPKYLMVTLETVTCDFQITTRMNSACTRSRK